MSFYRGRRLRRNAVIRSMVRETVLQAQDLIYPIFVEEGRRGKAPIAAMPGIHQYGLDALQEVVEEMQACGVRACILFGIPEHKDHAGSSASDPHGIVQEAIRTLKRLDPQLYVIADVCMCEYTDHGHCGILDAHGEVMNDETLTHLCRIALSYAHAGADMVAPSDMMDGHIQALRSALAGFYPSLANVHLVDYKVRVMDSKQATAARVRVLITSTDGVKEWTTVGVAGDVIEASWFALVDSIEYRLRNESHPDALEAAQ